jgi:hypothetical protein
MSDYFINLPLNSKQMHRGIIFCVFLILFFLSGPVSRSQGLQTSADTDRPVRVEIPVKSTDETYHLLPVSSTGALLYFKSVETINDSLTKWYFSLYDTDLHPLWVKSIPLRSELEVRDFSIEKDTITLLFIESEKTKGIARLEILLRLECKSGKITGSRYSLNGNIIPAKFVVFHDHAFLGYNLKNEPAHIQIIKTVTGEVADCMLTSQGTNSTITGFIIDTLSNTLYATIRKAISKKNNISDLLKINFSGTKISETEISTISPAWEIRNLQLFPVNTDDLLVIATYSEAGKSAKDGLSNTSTGFFTCRIRNGVQADIRFTSFLDLKNFKNILAEKDLEILKKKGAKKNQSMNEFAPEVNLLVHPLIVHNDQVLFLGESYIPEYHPENFTEFDFYGRPYINTYNVFDGYRYSSAIVAGFDKSGNLKWDNSMEIRNLISPELNPKVNIFCFSSDTMVLCYSSEARIASKIIKGNDVVEKLDFSTMEQMYPEDKMLTESKNYMVPWYGPFFLCYGFQEIKNINSSENKKRTVYYFTKVKFE